MLDAFALEYRTVVNGELSGPSEPYRQNDIMTMFRKAGLNRDSQVFSVVQNGLLKAALVVDTSDLGINMSELINSIKVIMGEMNNMGGPKGNICRYRCDIRPFLSFSEEHSIKYWFQNQIIRAIQD